MPRSAGETETSLRPWGVGGGELCGWRLPPLSRMNHSTKEWDLEGKWAAEGFPEWQGYLEEGQF